MTRQQRRRNVQGVFRVARPDLVRDRVILLVDDVMTTGATVSACAVKLNRAGARHVEVLTFARPLRDVLNISAEMARQGAKRDGTY
jgi:predicted amidophosphoribosyltransferase